MIRVLTVGSGPAQDRCWRALAAAGMHVQAADPAALMMPSDSAGARPAGPAHIVVIDAETAGEYGFPLAAQLRLTTSLGIVMLVEPGRQRERLLALSLGVDQCLVKPLDPRELELQLRNLYRRLHGDAPSVTAPAVLLRSGDIELPAWRFDLTLWTLATPSGTSVTLSLAEYHLLQHLFQQSGEVVSREQLLLQLDRRKVQIAARNLDLVVSRLRRKVARASGERLPVLSARGVGYVFTGHGQLVGAPSAGGPGHAAAGPLD